MSKLRTVFLGASYVSTALAAALLLSAPACGRTTSIGQVVPEPDGGASGNGGSAAGPAGDGAAATASGGASGSNTGGASGEAGSAGSATAGAGTKTACGVPQPNPIPNPTAAERERAALIRGLCDKLAEEGCLDAGESGGESLGWISMQTRDCPLGELVTACEQDLLFSYLHQIPLDCDREWQAMVRCETSADHTADPEHPNVPCTYLDPSDYSHGPAPARCLAERSALAACAQGDLIPDSVTGVRAKCLYGLGGGSSYSLDPNMCSVLCTVPAASGTDSNYFDTECSAPPGVPLLCNCWVNGNPLNEPTLNLPFSASNCREVAQLMADGECIERLDCCLKYTDNAGEHCQCMGNDVHGMASCAAAAQAAGGEVVDICPQYESQDGPCWPPWSDHCKQQP